jgi:uncharacterized damage-inducible protein DinB
VARPLIVDAFAYHAWATELLLTASAALPPAELDRAVPGTFGSVMTTLQHVVEGDRFQLWAAGAKVPPLDASRMSFDELLAAAKENAAAWTAFLADHDDADEPAIDVDDAGWRRTAPIGLRVAQALQHGIEHRTQVCIALTALGFQPPDLSGWAYGADTGAVEEVSPPE